MRSRSATARKVFVKFSWVRLMHLLEGCDPSLRRTEDSIRQLDDRLSVDGGMDRIDNTAGASILLASCLIGPGSEASILDHFT